MTAPVRSRTGDAAAVPTTREVRLTTGREKKWLVAVSAAALAALVCSCAVPQEEPELMKEFPVSGTDALVDTTGMVEFVEDVTSAGNGAFRAMAEEPVTVRLYELGDVDVENEKVIYKAKLRTEDADGHVYLEMLCNFPDGMEYFSRAVESPVYGTSEWTAQETPFMLEEGQNPDNVKLNLVVNGSGTVWIDEISVWRAPLR